MPTGYTAKVCDGEVTEFRDFALSCARAFGALISMRDDPMDAAIPDAFAPSTYHADALVKAKARLRELEAMTPEQIEVAAFQAHEAEAKSTADFNASRTREDENLRAMLGKVRAWSPPTPEHKGLKEFMEQQIAVSMNTYRSPEPVRKSGPDWLKEQIAKEQWNIDYHTKEQREENERAAGRTAWVKALKESLS